MKVYIFVDLEGATGVVHYDRSDSSRRKQYCEYLTSDINAAVDGAFEAGSKAVSIFDGHGNAIDLSMLDSRAQVIENKNSTTYLSGLDDSFSHFLLVGFHSMAGSGGLLNHTHSKRVKKIVLNGKEIGEIGMSVIYALACGVNPVFICGDDKAVQEAKSHLPGIEGVIVKNSISKTHARCFHSQTTHALIHTAVRRALSIKREKISDRYLPLPPYKMEVVYKQPWVAVPRYILKRKFKDVKVKNLFTIVYEGETFLKVMNDFV